MTRKTLHISGILALTGLAALVQNAKALTYNDGDLLLGLRAQGNTGGSTDYLINVGSATKFISGGVYATGSIVNLPISGVGADLTATYSSSISGAPDEFWYARTDLLFGVAGVQKTAGNGFANNTLFASRSEPTNGTQSLPWTQAGTLSQGTPAGKIQGTGSGPNGYSTGTATANNPVGTFQGSAASTPNTWAYFMPNGGGTTSTAAFAYWNGGIETAVGNSNNVADLYQLNVGTNGSPGTLLGGFRFNPDNSGTIQFSSNISQFAPVPEPASAGLLACGLFVLGTRRRRVARAAR